MTGVRVFYVPNESGDGRQFGIRRALRDLKRASLIDDYAVFSLLFKVRQGGDAEAHRESLLHAVQEFRPDIVLMQHLGGTGLTEKHFLELRNLGDFRLIYHEADPYTRLLHPLPREARLAGRFADIVFTVGSGTFAQNFRRTGAPRVQWVNSTYDPGRFGLVQPPHADRPFDVVMVANRNVPRLRGLPNWRARIQFVAELQARFGPRFAIYGRGWEGPSAQGPVPYSEQDAAIHSGWVSANWDHFAAEPDYFSNRLPISLAVGTVHATTWHPGFDRIFGDSTRGFLLTERSPSALADRIHGYLTTTTADDRVAEARRSQAYAASRFRQDDQLVLMLNAVGAAIAPSSASVAWDTSPEDPWEP